MATDLEKLVVQLSADIKGYEREMRKAMGVTNSQARAIENRYRQMNKNLDAIGKSSARALIAPLTGVGAALSAREVLRYADAWTSAKNSLAVAGIVGDRQVAVLERLHQSAQANAAPITALSDLFGKAAQASDNLGASQEELLKFSDGVAVALRVAGTSAGAASGALTQLGQLLGQARVQAEEFNSVNEGARPILIAVANGLDAAGGSVSKLKSLVTDGKVSGQQFFQAFLRGLPTIQSMAANATQTIDQGLTKINNAFTRYIGQTDESLSASQRLVAGLNALADNFDETADAVLKVAAIIAGALVGRSIAGMIASLGLGIAALSRFTAAIRSAMTMASLSTALGGLSAAAGPVGLVIGGAVVGALALFGTQSAKATEGARVYAKALEEVEAKAKASAAAVDEAGNKYVEAQRNSIEKGMAAAEEALAALRREFDGSIQLLDHFTMRDFVSPEQLEQLRELSRLLKSGEKSAEDVHDELSRLARTSYNGETLAQFLQPLLEAMDKALAGLDLLKEKRAELAGAPSLRETEIASDRKYAELVKTSKAFADEAARRASLTKDQLALETEIAKVRKDADAAGAIFTEGQIKAMAQANLAGDARRGGEGKKAKRERKDDYERDTQQVIDYTVALVAETEATRHLNPLVNDYGFAAEKARIQRELLTAAEKAGKEVTPELRQEIAYLAEQYATAEAEAAKLSETQDKQREKFEFYRETVKSAASGIASALSDGKLEWEELGDVAMSVLDRIIDKMLNDLIDAIFEVIAASNSGGKGGILGMVANLIGAGLGAAGGGSGGGGGIGWADDTFRADGGPVTRGKPYIVGEKRPELFVPDQNGRIVPRLPTAMPSLAGMNAGVSTVFSPNISVDARGAQPGVGGEIDAVMKRFEERWRREFPQMTAKALKTIKVMGLNQ